MIQDDLEGQKKRRPLGGYVILRQWTSLSKPGIGPGLKAVLFTSAGLIQLCTKLAAQSSHKRRRVKIIYFMTYINESYPLESAPEINWTAVSGLSEEPEAAERETKQLGCPPARRRRLQEFKRCTRIISSTVASTF